MPQNPNFAAIIFLLSSVLSMQFHLRIQIKDIKSPPVWRELLVPATFSFDKLHTVIQAAFGWQDYHLYLFSKEGFVSSPWIKIPDEGDGDDDVRVYNARRTKIKDYVLMWQKFYYIYDFGDSWKHEIKLINLKDGSPKHASLLAGKGACPPEDCGGAYGYEELKKAIKNPASEEAQELMAWAGWDEENPFDATEFDFEAAAKAVEAV